MIQEVARSGLRGRGGAGFPTGEKWRAIRAVGTGPRFAVCNAAEGEPATFKDRLLLRTNPYQVLEGLAIAAYAVGAERAYVGVKEAFTAEVQALSRALGEMREADALGGVAVEIVLGPDLYLLVRARGSTGGQKCALPTGESLLMQSLVQVFGDEFASHFGRSCPLPRELPFHKIVDWDALAERFAYDLAYEKKQPDWTYSS